METEQLWHSVLYLTSLHLIFSIYKRELKQVHFSVKMIKGQGCKVPVVV